MVKLDSIKSLNSMTSQREKDGLYKRFFILEHEQGGRPWSQISMRNEGSCRLETRESVVKTKSTP